MYTSTDNSDYYNTKKCVLSHSYFTEPSAPVNAQWSRRTIAVEAAAGLLGRRSERRGPLPLPSLCAARRKLWLMRGERKSEKVAPWLPSLLLPPSLALPSSSPSLPPCSKLFAAILSSRDRVAAGGGRKQSRTANDLANYKTVTLGLDLSERVTQKAGETLPRAKQRKCETVY